MSVAMLPRGSRASASRNIDLTGVSPWPWCGVTGRPLDVLRQWQRERRRVAIATLIAEQGSSPRPVGSEMYVSDDGTCIGFLSGGCVEGTVAQLALEVLTNHEPQRVVFGEGSRYIDIKLTCGASIEIFIRELHDVSAYVRLLEAGEKRRRFFNIATHLSTGAWRISAEGDRREGEFIRHHPPPIRLALVGADPITLATAMAAHHSGLDVVLLRPLGPLEQPPHLTLCLYDHRPLDVSLNALRLDRQSAIYSLAHDEDIDHAVMLKGLRSDAFAIGVLGSRKKIPHRIRRLDEEGFAPAQIKRIHMPAGIHISSKMPQHIAISIVAEVLASAPSEAFDLGS